MTTVETKNLVNNDTRANGNAAPSTPSRADIQFDAVLELRKQYLESVRRKESRQ